MVPTVNIGDLRSILQLAAGPGSPLTLEVRTVANPAAGAASATFTVPGGELWVINSVFARFVADANVANRQLALTVSVDGSNVGRHCSRAVQTAGTTIDYTWAFGTDADTSTVVGTQEQPIPAYVLKGGSTIALGVTAVQVGDQLSRLAAFITRMDAPPLSGFVSFSEI